MDPAVIAAALQLAGTLLGGGGSQNPTQPSSAGVVPAPAPPSMVPAARNPTVNLGLPVPVPHVEQTMPDYRPAPVRAADVHALHAPSAFRQFMSAIQNPDIQALVQRPAQPQLPGGGILQPQMASFTPFVPQQIDPGLLTVLLRGGV